MKPLCFAVRSVTEEIDVTRILQIFTIFNYTYWQKSYNMKREKEGTACVMLRNDAECAIQAGEKSCFVNGRVL